MNEPLYNVLFLCTHNSARSIMAEVLMNRWGQGRFRAFSAGSHPSGNVNPFALALLQAWNMPLADSRSKSWEEFAGPSAPRLDFVFTVCDSAAGEVCPVWPGQPMTAHWGVPDPAAVSGNDAEKVRAFRNAYLTLEARIKLFASLPIAKLERIKLQERLEQIGRAGGTDPG